MVGFAISVVLACILAWLCVAYREVVGDRERLGDVIDEQMSRAIDAEKKLALSVKNCQQLMDEVERDREWKAEAVLQLAAYELAKQELLANLAQPFRKRKPWSDLISRLFRDEGSKTS